MILLVNGGLCFFMAFSAWGISRIGAGKSDNISEPMQAVSLGLVIVGFVLVVLGWALRRRPQTPALASDPSR